MKRRQAFIAGTWLLLALACWFRAELTVGAESEAAPATEAAAAAVAMLEPGAASVTEQAAEVVKVFRPLVILVVGMATVLILIIGLKIHPFIALTVAAMNVSVMAAGWLGEGQWAASIARVADAFGSSAGKIGIVIGMAAVIGK